ncbi:ADP compounds hydrolase NudE [Kangiella sp. HZ709]|uniref:ADP compounds hydrolase NudE n=1 Tax=Kangiella sp. HZ709 TaxID=2666328 RepID=UPI0012B05CE1|nr:ADP compounds hydrolase NudE [Kangiella sp. HZ709]MRX28228.1 ADP compounds hydrolase NudE [Kangiella sp. HZ709]
MSKLPKIKQSKIVAQTRLFAVEELSMEFSNGEKRIYERLKAGSNGAVLVIPVVDEEHFLLIKEYAAGVEAYELAFPKGLVEPAEKSIDAANRELQEETGFAANKLTQLKKISLAPGYLSHKMDVVVAEDLYPSKLEGDEPEPIEVIQWKFSDIEQLLLRDDFTEARSIAALYLLQSFLQQKD